MALNDDIQHVGMKSPQIPTPSKDPGHLYLRRGDLVRVSQAGIEKSKRLKDRDGFLGRITKSNSIDGTCSVDSYLYDVDWVLGGKLSGCERADLVYRTADDEGMTDSTDHRRQKQKPVNLMEEVARMDALKKERRQNQQLKMKQKQQKANLSNKIVKATKEKNRKAVQNPETKSDKNLHSTTYFAESDVEKGSDRGKKRRKPAKSSPGHTDDEKSISTSLDLFERQMREFNRFFARLKDKVDLYRHFWSSSHQTSSRSKADTSPTEGNWRSFLDDVSSCDSTCDSSSQNKLDKNKNLILTQYVDLDGISSLNPPKNWEELMNRADNGRYIIDREYEEERLRFTVLGEYYQSLPEEQRPSRTFPAPRTVQIAEIGALLNSRKDKNSRVSQVIGINWDLFRKDVFEMCDAALEQIEPDEDDCGQRGTISNSVRKVKESLDQFYERTCRRHASEMITADGRHKFSRAIENYSNKEAAMQTWRKDPFPERRYERITYDAVCDGLSKVDERIATYELRTNLPNSFIGQSYHYNDIGLSEIWMKSVVDETESIRGNKKSKLDQNREAALALAADEGVRRAQVNATMQSLLIGVQDRVMTDLNVLHQSELTSENWQSEEIKQHSLEHSQINRSPTSKTNIAPRLRNGNKIQTTSNRSPQIVEKPVWGLDCYTRRNIMVCLEVEFDATVALSFIEKWLLPAINACPEILAQNIGNAARILEGLPFDSETMVDPENDNDGNLDVPTYEDWERTFLGRALLTKIRSSSPHWLKYAAQQLRIAREALGESFFLVHPKGNGSVLLMEKVEANRLVTFYHGELYPSWRWGEKMEAIDMTQQRKDLKPALPDFYNMALERPQKDPRGYSLLFVDASRKAGHGSSLSHSCVPTCEVRVAAMNGELCLAMSTLRELECGEELTFDYNAVTESLNEYRSAVCLCGYGKCRGSFLHYATADCYQQILTRNSPVASRFASLVKGSMKQKMSDEDEKVLQCHGFQTAAFGAISVNRRDTSSGSVNNGLEDSMNIVPIWLRTYVADTLRYIEYERRALPIALICDNTESNQESEPENVEEASAAKGPRFEGTFFYFLRTEAKFLNSLVEKECLPSTLIGLQRWHTHQKIASNYWKHLDEETKQAWKQRALKDFERKTKEFQLENKREICDSQRKKSKEKRVASKEQSKKNLNSSHISFQDADAEGMLAMEQRIQQLTQSLSRVGRVLDRHREECFEKWKDFGTPIDDAHAVMRNLVHPPLEVLSDADVVSWIWCSEYGPVSSLLKGVDGSSCVRPGLLESLKAVIRKFPSLGRFGDSTTSSDLESESHMVSAHDLRGRLKEALLELRATIIFELKEMARHYKNFKNRKNLTKLNVVEVAPFDSESNGQHSGPLVAQPIVCDEIKELEGTTAFIGSSDIASPNEEEKKQETDDSLLSERNKSEETGATDATQQQITPKHGSWELHYGQRVALEACADLLLLYANTTNYFSMKAYETLESSPVEVYARELGNSVPVTIIDRDLTNDRDAALTPNCKLITNEVKGAGRKANRVSSSCSLCQPDDIVAKVTVKYQGDYTLSQLLQWYNAGIGQKPGLPDLLGCTVLPSLSGCWSSELLSSTKLKVEGKTVYESKVRPALVTWMQDPFERGNPWPSEVRKGFVEQRIATAHSDMSCSFVTFGSPVIDFLVSGDDTNINTILSTLDVDDKVATKTSFDGLLASVDKGRPAQAVSTWVQCEGCLKWRKIPWYVDADILPETFYCKDNKWNPTGNACDFPEDDWDESDALVGADGKVEGSPLKKFKGDGSSVSDENCFAIGARFDVKRSGAKKFTVGTVGKVDFSGLQKRILFLFPKRCADRDEWIPFGSDRIAPLYTIVTPPPQRKEKSSGINKSSTSLFEESSFFVGAKFDVRRSDKDYFSLAFVTRVDFVGTPKKVRFHFSKSSTCRDEWVIFGSDRIAPVNTKSKERTVVPTKISKKRKALALGNVSLCDSSNIHQTVHKNTVILHGSDQKSIDEFDKKAKTKERSRNGAIPNDDVTLSQNGTMTTKLLPDTNDHDKINEVTTYKLSDSRKRTGNKMKKKKGSALSGTGLGSTCEPRTTVANEQSIIFSSSESTIPDKTTQDHTQADVIRSAGKIKKKDENKRNDYLHKLGSPLARLPLPTIARGQYEGESTSESQNARTNGTPTREQNEAHIGIGGKSKHYVGVVKDVKVMEGTTMLLFHFPKTHVKFDEWVEVGSSRICPVNTKSIDKLANQEKKNNFDSSHYCSSSTSNTNKEMSVGTAPNDWVHPSLSSCTSESNGKSNASVAGTGKGLSCPPPRTIISDDNNAEDLSMRKRDTLLQFEDVTAYQNGFSQPSNNVTDSFDATAKREGFQLHDFSKNNLECPTINHNAICSGENWIRVNSSNNYLNRQPAFQQVHGGGPNYNTNISYVVSECNNNGRHFQSHSQFMSQQDNVYINPSSSGDKGSANHGFASFDKLLLLASASHGQEAQQTNVQRPHVPQFVSENGINYQNQQVQYSYQHQTPQSDLNWSGWSNPGNK